MPGDRGFDAGGSGRGEAGQEAGGVQGRLDLSGAAQRRRVVAGARRRAPGGAEGPRFEGADDLQGERLQQRVRAADRRRSRPRRLQHDLRHLVRDVRARRQRPARRQVPERPVRAGDRDPAQEEPGRVLRCGRGHDLPVRHGGRRRDQEGRDRLRGALRHPRSRPPPQRLHPRRPGHASGREGEDRLDERVVLAAEGDGRREGPRRRRRRRDRTERRQPRGRCLCREGRGPLGRLRLRREEVRAEAVADRGGLRLGLVLRPPRQGRDQRHLEAGLLLRLGQGRLHEPGGLRARRSRRRRRPRSPRRSSRSSPESGTRSAARSTTRAAS